MRGTIKGREAEGEVVVVKENGNKLVVEFEDGEPVDCDANRFQPI
jgi:hypothetical protein